MKAKFEDWWKKNKGGEIIEVESMPFILQHPTNLIALANLDGLFGDNLVEYKTTSERNYKQWEEDNLPDYYYLQTQWYLYATNYQYCYIAFLIGNRKFDVKLIERNEEVIKQIVEKADYFWNNFVVQKTPPAPSGDESSKEALAMMYPKEEAGKIIDVTGDIGISKNFAKIAEINEQVKILQEELEVNKQAIKARQGDNEILLCGEEKSKWTLQFRKEYIVEASSSRVFRISKNKGGNLNGN
jgi:predicted phage-related endonuclease